MRKSYIQDFLRVVIRLIDSLQQLLIVEVPLQTCWRWWKDFDLSMGVSILIISEIVIEMLMPGCRIIIDACSDLLKYFVSVSGGCLITNCEKQ